MVNIYLTVFEFITHGFIKSSRQNEESISMGINMDKRMIVNYLWIVILVQYCDALEYRKIKHILTSRHTLYLFPLHSIDSLSSLHKGSRYKKFWFLKFEIFLTAYTLWAIVKWKQIHLSYEHTFEVRTMWMKIAKLSLSFKTIIARVFLLQQRAAWWRNG